MIMALRLAIVIVAATTKNRVDDHDTPAAARGEEATATRPDARSASLAPGD
jgi:hypothetical protein